MTPKLYLIESEEKDGLVKIGFAGSGDNNSENDVVYERIGQYAVGISDSSTVHEILGAPIFEKYLHKFIEQKQKPISIKFKLTGRIRRPQEWFILPPNISEIFVSAFSEEHPTNMDDLSVDDLPIFLSGAMSAIHWHAQNIPAPELAEMTVRKNLLSEFEKMRTQQVERGSAQNQNQEHDSRSLEQTPISNSFANNLIQSVGQAERLKAEMTEMREMEASRTIIALVSALMIVFLLFTGATISGCIFAILASLLYAGWPTIQPYGASILVNLSNRLKKNAKKSRNQSGNYDN